MLKNKYGLMADDPYRFVVYEREFPLSEDLKTAMAKEDHQLPVMSRQQDGSSCKVSAGKSETPNT